MAEMIQHLKRHARSLLDRARYFLAPYKVPSVQITPPPSDSLPQIHVTRMIEKYPDYARLLMHIDESTPIHYHPKDITTGYLTEQP